MNATSKEAAAAQKVENMFIKSMDITMGQRARAHKAIDFYTAQGRQAIRSVDATTLHFIKHLKSTIKQSLETVQGTFLKILECENDGSQNTFSLKYDLPSQVAAATQQIENIFTKSMDTMMEQRARAQKTIEFVTAQAHQSVVATLFNPSKHFESATKLCLDTVQNGVQNTFSLKYGLPSHVAAVTQQIENIFIKSMNTMMEQHTRADKTIEFVTAQAYQSVVDTTLHLSKHLEIATKQFLDTVQNGVRTTFSLKYDFPSQAPAATQQIENNFIKLMDKMMEECGRTHKTIEFVTAQVHQSVVATTLHPSRHLESATQYLDTVQGNLRNN